jgi:uncharacterized C2H2 Zn-finger protein
MARSRRNPSGTKSTGKSAASLKCPECGKTFVRAASLGAHRNRAHGVAGKSNTATSRRSRSRTAATNPSSRQHSGIDRNQLLEAVFPNGVPPREEVIRRVSNWLDEAEQLARL